MPVMPQPKSCANIGHAKRHKEWESFTSTLCRTCLQEHVKEFSIRYPVAACCTEQCDCPCHAISLQIETIGKQAA